MNYEQIQGIMTTSSPTDWILAQGFYVPEGSPDVMPPSRAIYKKDIAVSLEWHIESSDSFHEPWLELFGDQQAPRDYIQVLYNGVPIAQEYGVSVDNRRTMFPVPRIEIPGKRWSIPEEKRRLFALVNGIEHLETAQGPAGSDFAHCLSRALSSNYFV